MKFGQLEGEQPYPEDLLTMIIIHIHPLGAHPPSSWTTFFPKGSRFFASESFMKINENSWCFMVCTLARQIWLVSGKIRDIWSKSEDGGAKPLQVKPPVCFRSHNLPHDAHTMNKAQNYARKYRGESADTPTTAGSIKCIAGMYGPSKKANVGAFFLACLMEWSSNGRIVDFSLPRTFLQTIKMTLLETENLWYRGHVNFGADRSKKQDYDLIVINMTSASVTPYHTRWPLFRG